MTYWRLLCETSARGVKGTSVAYCLQKFPETADLNDPKASRMQPAAPDKFTLVGLWQILRNVLYFQTTVGYCALEYAFKKRWAWTGNIPSKTAQEQNVGKAGLHLDLSLLLSLNMMLPHFLHATSIKNHYVQKIHLRTSFWIFENKFVTICKESPNSSCWQTTICHFLVSTLGNDEPNTTKYQNFRKYQTPSKIKAYKLLPKTLIII